MSEGDLPDGTSEIFLRGGLGDPNHVESAREFGLYAHAIWNSEGFASEAGAGEIHLIGPGAREGPVCSRDCRSSPQSRRAPPVRTSSPFTLVCIYKLCIYTH
jgi:hypothetical protein